MAGKNVVVAVNNTRPKKYRTIRFEGTRSSWASFICLGGSRTPLTITLQSPHKYPGICFDTAFRVMVESIIFLLHLACCGTAPSFIPFSMQPCTPTAFTPPAMIQFHTPARSRHTAAQHNFLPPSVTLPIFHTMIQFHCDTQASCRHAAAQHHSLHHFTISILDTRIQLHTHTSCRDAAAQHAWCRRCLFLSESHVLRLQQPTPRCYTATAIDYNNNMVLYNAIHNLTISNPPPPPPSHRTPTSLTSSTLP